MSGGRRAVRPASAWDKTMDKLYFDDISEEMVVEFGQFEMTQDEIIRFAKAYDPQSFHIEPVPAPGSPFPKLIASGWNTAAERCACWSKTGS